MNSPLLLSSSSPGVKLFSALVGHFNNSNSAEGFAAAADRFFKADGELVNVINERIVSYTVRRMIHGIRFRLEELGTINNYVSQNLEVIRDFIVNTTSLAVDDELVNELAALIQASLNSAPKSVKSKRRRNFIKNLQDNGITSCYICGIYLNFSEVTNEASPELEHLFPRTFGGLNDESNYQVSCKKCNGLKDDAIGPFDFHFEHISTRHTDAHQDFRKKLFKRSNSVAIKLKEHCKCGQCGRSAQEAGELRATRKDNNDSWHYLNIGLICNDHNI
jgi:hypothetical protein